MPRITLKAARVNVGMTQIQVAKTLNISVSTVKNWEKGTSYPKQPHIEQLCKLYGVAYDNIFFGNELA